MQFQNKVAFTPEQIDYCDFLCAHRGNFDAVRIMNQMMWKFPELKNRGLEIYALVDSCWRNQGKVG